jgi:hypothetical protein
MFEGSPFLKALQDHSKGIWDDPIHWVLVADLGGYTLDFSMLGFRLEDPGDMEGTFGCDSAPMEEFPPRFARLSYPFGVMDLDQMVYDVLPAGKQKAIDDMVSDVDQRRLEAFHRVFYRTMEPFRIGQVTIGEGSEGNDIRNAIHRFVSRIRELAQRFLDAHQFPRVNQLVLTGGGSNIPAVRRALIEQLAPGHTHAGQTEDDEISELLTNYVELGNNEVRGATATGGTSVYCEFLNG